MSSFVLKKENPIAVMDSGLGGISVLRELLAVLPGERYIYFGDSQNAPYGEKTQERLISLCRDNVEMLLARGCKCIVIACNTATAAAAETLRLMYADVPIIGMEPAVKPAASHGGHPRVLVLATPLTIQGDRLHHLVEAHADDAAFILKAAPELVHFVENGVCDASPSGALFSYLRMLLSAYIASDDPKAERLDAIVLGCTHFPFVKNSILKTLGYPIAVYDGAHGTALQTERRLREAGLLSEEAYRRGVMRVELLNSDETKLAAELMLLMLPAAE